jgi:hypothetical protein
MTQLTPKRISLKLSTCLRTALAERAYLAKRKLRSTAGKTRNKEKKNVDFV